MPVINAGVFKLYDLDNLENEEEARVVKNLAQAFASDPEKLYSLADFKICDKQPLDLTDLVMWTTVLSKHRDSGKLALTFMKFNGLTLFFAKDVQAALRYLSAGFFGLKI